MKRLQVAVVIHGYFPRVGGAEKQMQYLAARLLQLGVDIHIITRRYDKTLKSFELIDGIPVHRLPVPGPKPVASLVFTVYALVLLAKLRPQVIHAHEFISPATVALLANRWFRIPFLVTPHLSGPNGDVHKLMRKSSGRVRMNELRERAQKFILISREIEAELASVGIVPEQMLAIPNGVNVDHFAPPSTAEKNVIRQEFGIPSSALVAIFTGRLAPVKRVDHLIETWHKIRVAYPAAELMLVGAGPEEERLRKMAGAGVHFLGSQGDVARCLKAADVFVLPSSAEGLSVAMLEAMSCGLAALLTDVGGAREVIVHGENGWLISPTSPTDLYDGLNALFADEKLRARMGQAARQRIISSYSINAAADTLHAAYTEIAQAGSK